MNMKKPPDEFLKQGRNPLIPAPPPSPSPSPSPTSPSNDASSIKPSTPNDALSTVSSDSHGSGSIEAPLPGVAVQQVQQPRPDGLNYYGGTFAVNDRGQTLGDFDTHQ